LQYSFFLVIPNSEFAILAWKLSQENEGVLQHNEENMPEDTLPRYDELYVISDIHMGGKRGFQILKHGPRLGAFIEHIANVQPHQQVALVLNGDVIDSLAEDIEGYVAMGEAPRMMQRIYDDPTFKPVWHGLASFLEKINRHLIIVIGNHDIELALPAVERSIRRRIAGDSYERSGRLHFATHGGGYACQVGDARVFCTHGNEVDDWNVVDYDRLGQLGNALNAGRDPEASKWEPNAGTRLVMRVMNDIKRDYPFVDLLKPETKSVPGVLMALDPGRVRKLKLNDAAYIVKDKIKGALVTRDLLSADSEDIDETADVQAAAEVAMDELLGANLREVADVKHSRGGDRSAEDLLLAVEEDFEAGKTALEVGQSESQEGTLGVWQYVVDRFRGVPKEEALRKALLDWLDNDETFDLATRDSTFDAITERTGPEVDFVVTGHTHLKRAIRIDGGDDRFYYNCGTWIRLIQFTKAVLNDANEFSKVYQALAAKSMAAIDDAKIPGADGSPRDLVLDNTTAVHIAVNEGGVIGELLYVRGVDDGSPVTFEQVSGSEFFRRSAPQ